MQEPEKEQRAFSSILFDALFGLLIFVGFQGFFSLRSLPHLVLYILCILVVIHWWLLFKSADDRFQGEVNDSVIDVFFGIGYILLLEFIMISADSFHVTTVVWLIAGVLFLDCVWALLWRFVGEWRSKDVFVSRAMERELNATIAFDLVFGILLVIAAAICTTLPSEWVLAILATLYLGYSFATFKKKIINVNWF